MKYQAILFDMDGTLVPMDLQTFLNGYLKLLLKKLEKHNINPDTFEQDMLVGVGAIYRNDGSRTNEDAFWDAFEKQSGLSKERILEDCLDFYANDFKNARQFTYENPLAVTAVSTAKTKAGRVILATNPFFPMAAQIVRMGYVGLTPDMFDYISCYEKDRFCKPNPKYLLDLCNMFGLDPEKCLLVGNDVKEDMYCAALTKMDTFLVTDCMIPYDDYLYIGKQGTFTDLVKYLESL